MSKPIKIIFLDSDLATLLSNIKETAITPVDCAIFVQIVSRVILKQPGRKKRSAVITMVDLHVEWFPFWSLGKTKRILQKLREIGVVRTQMVYRRVGKAPQRFTRIEVDEKRITELAEQVRDRVGLVEMAKRVNGD